MKIKYTGQWLGSLDEKEWLPILNPEICPQNKSAVEEGKEHDWPGTAEVYRYQPKIGYILSLPNQESKPAAITRQRQLSLELSRALDLIDDAYHYLKFNPPDKTKMAYNKWESLLASMNEIKIKYKTMKINKDQDLGEVEMYKPPGYPSYIGAKVVQAIPMEYEIWARQQNKWEENQETLGDGYMVIYDDGYRSWSPKSVFEGCYRRISEMEKRLI